MSCRYLDAVSRHFQYRNNYRESNSESISIEGLKSLIPYYRATRPSDWTCCFIFIVLTTSKYLKSFASWVLSLTLKKKKLVAEVALAGHCRKLDLMSSEKLLRWTRATEFCFMRRNLHYFSQRGFRGGWRFLVHQNSFGQSFGGVCQSCKSLNIYKHTFFFFFNKESSGNFWLMYK